MAHDERVRPADRIKALSTLLDRTAPALKTDTPTVAIENNIVVRTQEGELSPPPRLSRLLITGSRRPPSGTQLNRCVTGRCQSSTHFRPLLPLVAFTG
jgi:hypothetical protein